MRVRRLVTCALVVVLGLSSVTAMAQAAAKKKPPPPLCRLVVSPAESAVVDAAWKTGNDTTGHALPVQTSPAYDPALDVLSADIASNAKTVTVVFRLAKLGGPGTTAPLGRFYAFDWQWGSSGVGEHVFARITPQGNTYGPGTGSTGVVDVAHNEIRVSGPIDGLISHPTMPRGERMTNLVVKTDLANPAVAIGTTQGFVGDYVTSTKVYPAGAPSCVKVGV